MNEDSNQISLLQGRLDLACQFLERTLNVTHDEIQRAAAVQGFEMCFELAWKLLRLRLQKDGLEAESPGATIRESARTGLIDSAEQWMEFLKYRNLSTHTYNETLAEETYSLITSSFLAEIKSYKRSSAPPLHWQNHPRHRSNC